MFKAHRQKSAGRETGLTGINFVVTFQSISSIIICVLYETQFYTHNTHNRLTALFRDYLGEPVPER